MQIKSFSDVLNQIDLTKLTPGYQEEVLLMVGAYNYYIRQRDMPVPIAYRMYLDTALDAARTQGVLKNPIRIIYRGPRLSNNCRHSTPSMTRRRDATGFRIYNR